MKKLIPRYNLEAMMPKIKRVRLPSSKAVVKIPYRDAKDCIMSFFIKVLLVLYSGASFRLSCSRIRPLSFKCHSSTS